MVDEALRQVPNKDSQYHYLLLHYIFPVFLSNFLMMLFIFNLQETEILIWYSLFWNLISNYK